MPEVGIQPRPPVPLSPAGKAHKHTLGNPVPHTHPLNLLDRLFLIRAWMVFIKLFATVVNGELYLRSSVNENINRLERKVALFILALAIILTG